MNTVAPNTVRYPVPGMSCQHCVAAITAEVGAIHGVRSVEVSLDDKLVTVVGEVAPDAVAAAIEEAGFDVVGDPQPVPGA